MKKILFSFLLIFIFISDAKSQNSYDFYINRLKSEIDYNQTLDATKTIRFIERNFKNQLTDEFYRLKGIKYLIENKNKKAKKSMKKAILLNPNSVNYSDMGNIYFGENNFIISKEYYLMSYFKDSLYYWNLESLANVYLYIGKYDSSLYFISKIPINLQERSTLIIKSKVLRLLGNYQQAIESCNTLLSNDSFSYSMCLFDSYVDLLWFDSIPKLIPILMKNELIADKEFGNQYYYRIFFKSLLINSIHIYKNTGDFELVKQKVYEAHEFGDLSKYYLDVELLRYFAKLFFYNKEYKWAYYFCSYIENHNYEDFSIIVKSSNVLGINNKLTKKANKFFYN